MFFVQSAKLCQVQQGVVRALTDNDYVLREISWVFYIYVAVYNSTSVVGIALRFLPRKVFEQNSDIKSCLYVDYKFKGYITEGYTFRVNKMHLHHQ